MISRIFKRTEPKLSIVVVAYDMARALPRTLKSLSADYQSNVSADDYEVIVVDNGSPQPLSKGEVTSFGTNFHYHILKNASQSPASAINAGAAMARGKLIGIMIDGARILSPGFIHYGLAAFRLYPQAVVATPGWHLGPTTQQEGSLRGYSEDEEDELLDSIGWPADGYRLFEISTLAVSSSEGCFRPISECNSLIVTRSLFNELGGYDEQFDSIGGGLVNHDFYRRALENPDATLIMMPGEGSFHQIHGGISTNTDKEKNRERANGWREEYAQIRLKPFTLIDKKPVFLGEITQPAMVFLEYSARKARQK